MDPMEQVHSARIAIGIHKEFDVKTHFHHVIFVHFGILDPMGTMLSWLSIPCAGFEELFS